MATAPALRLVRDAQPSTTDESWEALITRYGQAFMRVEARKSSTDWDKAFLVKDFDVETRRHPAMQGKPRHEISRHANTDLRAWMVTQRQPAVRPRFMADARKVFALWGDILAGKDISFDVYRHIAVCNLPREQKDELRSWVEQEQPARYILRHTIKERVDALQGVYRPDFDLKVSNHWIFTVADEKRLDGFHGGVNAALYANLIHYFSNPGDTVLDPFAGGGLLASTLKRYKHFQTVTQAEFSGPRTALMADIAPQHADIVQADARQGLPFPEACAHLAIADPPYLTMASGKYAELGTVLVAWLDGLRAALRHIARCLTPEGLLVLMTDDVLRKHQHIPLGYKVMALLEEEGWSLVTTLYNFNRNFLTMTPAAMAGTKHARFHVNAVKVLQVARRPQML